MVDVLVYVYILSPDDGIYIHRHLSTSHDVSQAMENE